MRRAVFGRPPLAAALRVRGRLGRLGCFGRLVALPLLLAIPRALGDFGAALLPQRGQPALGKNVQFGVEDAHLPNMAPARGQGRESCAKPERG